MRGADSHRAHLLKNVFGKFHAVWLNQQNGVESLTVPVTDPDWLGACRTERLEKPSLPLAWTSANPPQNDEDNHEDNVTQNYDRKDANSHSLVIQESSRGELRVTDFRL